MAKFERAAFGAVCVAGAGMLLYFAQLSASQSVPAYSTLNSKADGAKLLFDALKMTGGTKVLRQFKNIGLQKPVQACVLFLGVFPMSLEFEEASYFDEMEKSARAGNRLVIAVTDDGGADLEPQAKSQLAERWGIRFLKEPGLQVDQTWQPVPEIGAEVWRRTFGKGEILFAGHTGRLNNNGIAAKEENRQLFHQLLGKYPTVIFEEAHLGIRETGSIAALARHYHLQGLLAGLILVAALFIWSRSVRFPPSPPMTERATAGSDTRAVLTELMSRHLKGGVMAGCVAEWNRTNSHLPAILEATEEQGAVAAYARIQTKLQEKTKSKI